MDFLGYLGERGRRRVLGRWKETEVRVLRLMVEEAPLRAAFFRSLGHNLRRNGRDQRVTFRRPQRMGYVGNSL